MTVHKLMFKPKVGLNSRDLYDDTYPSLSSEYEKLLLG